MRKSECLDVPVELLRIQDIKGRKFLGYPPSSPQRQVVGQFPFKIEAWGKAGNMSVLRPFDKNILQPDSGRKPEQGLSYRNFRILFCIDGQVVHIRIAAVRSRSVTVFSQRRVHVIFPSTGIPVCFPLYSCLQMALYPAEPPVKSVFDRCCKIQLL